jgi:hypothetical protein
LKSFSENRTLTATIATTAAATASSSGSKFAGNPAAEVEAGDLDDEAMDGTADGTEVGDGTAVGLLDGTEASDGGGSMVGAGVGAVEGFASGGSSCWAVGKVAMAPYSKRARDIARIGASTILVFDRLMFAVLFYAF